MVAQISKPLPKYKKIVLKPANEVKLKYQSSTKNFSLVNILCVTYFVTSLTMPDPQSSDMRHIW